MILTLSLTRSRPSNLSAGGGNDFVWSEWSYAMRHALCAIFFSLQRLLHDNIDQVVPLKGCLVKDPAAVEIADSADNHRGAAGG
jgi:hypothetical protein